MLQTFRDIVVGRGAAEVRGGERKNDHHAILTLVWVLWTTVGTWIQHLSVFVSRSEVQCSFSYIIDGPPCTLPTQGGWDWARSVRFQLAISLVNCLHENSPCFLQKQNVKLKTSQPSFTTRYILTVEKCKLTTSSWSQKQKMDCWRQTKLESKMKMFTISSKL